MLDNITTFITPSVHWDGSNQYTCGNLLSVPLWTCKSNQRKPRGDKSAFHLSEYLTSTMRPLLMTQMRSAPWMVLSRWAMISTVRPLVALSRASCTTRSDSASRALVASSSTRMLGFLIRARAMAMRCFWPPDSVAPRSPGSELYSLVLKWNTNF